CAHLVAAALCFLTLLFLTPLFRDMPHPALAAIVIAAMLHLSKPDYLRRLFTVSRQELGVAMLVIAGERTLGVLHGIALGVVISVVLLIHKTSHPGFAVLGQLPGTEAYRNIKVHKEARTFPGLLIWRPDGDMFFANAAYFARNLKAALAESQPPAREIL